MYYMDREKSDTTFAALHRADRCDDADHRAVHWGRVVVFALLAVALVVGFKFLAGL
jgi:hypothetical protein